MRDLEEILEGQDISLVWRRDGLSCFPVNKYEREDAYRRMASLKTGALFRLLGHLVMEDRSMDETLTQIGYVPPFLVLESFPFYGLAFRHLRRKSILLKLVKDGVLRYKMTAKTFTRSSTQTSRALWQRICETENSTTPSFWPWIPQVERMPSGP
jgi:hypothetical protein